MNLAAEVKRVAEIVKAEYTASGQTPMLFIMYRDLFGKRDMFIQDLGKIMAATKPELSKTKVREVIASFGATLAKKGEKVLATITTSEAWMAVVEKNKDQTNVPDEQLMKNLPRPSEMPNRREAIVVMGMDNKGNEIQEMYEIKTSMDTSANVTRKIMQTPTIEIHSKGGKLSRYVQDGKESKTTGKERGPYNPLLQGFWRPFKNNTLTTTTA